MYESVLLLKVCPTSTPSHLSVISVSDIFVKINDYEIKIGTLNALLIFPSANNGND